MSLFLALAFLAQAGNAAPYVPQSDGEVLERLPYRANDAFMRETRQMREALAREPRDPVLAVALAQRYFDKAAAEGDPRFIGYAQAALQPWWDLRDAPARVLVMRASLRQYRHDFEGALADLAQALARDSGDARAWSLRSVIHLVQADYEAARSDCAQYAPRVPELTATGCVAFIDGLTGRALPAHDTLALALTRTPDATPQEKLWVLMRLAEMAWRLSDPDKAEAHFKRALALDLTDAFLLAAYADFLLDYGRAREVIALLSDKTRADPLLLRLALAEQAAGAPGLGEHRAALADRYAAARLRGDTTHEQEESRFSLQIMKQADAALKLAQSNWQVQREPRDARVLLEAALALRQPAAAQPVLEWMRRSGIQDSYLERLAGQLASPKKIGS